ncbi:hypothetical protein E2C01_012962 [Portunus trituberculatus]|uniref:Uncharacterized protein n=1 Tax=Portunus trituberculatus TaxID=210409 RepID=A0A5B7DEZ8_PORTR|nr:hypothetical protein [Portunus trituberculatus]
MLIKDDHCSGMALHFIPKHRDERIPSPPDQASSPSSVLTFQTSKKRIPTTPKRLPSAGSETMATPARLVSLASLPVAMETVPKVFRRLMRC